MIDQLRVTFNQLGAELYGEKWEMIARHNVERITCGQFTETSALTIDQLNKLIAGMRKLNAKRHQVAVRR